jgi:hypothetical protein
MVVIKCLNPEKVYPGHVARDIILEGHTDVDYSLRYLRFFCKHVLDHEGQNPPKYIYDLLCNEFPDAVGSLEFQLNHTVENFGMLWRVMAEFRERWNQVA